MLKMAAVLTDSYSPLFWGSFLLITTFSLFSLCFSKGFPDLIIYFFYLAFLSQACCLAWLIKANIWCFFLAQTLLFCWREWRSSSVLTDTGRAVQLSPLPYHGTRPQAGQERVGKSRGFRQPVQRGVSGERSTWIASSALLQLCLWLMRCKKW